jgi:hypothetical protein
LERFFSEDIVVLLLDLIRNDHDLHHPREQFVVPDLLLIALKPIALARLRMLVLQLLSVQQLPIRLVFFS